MPIYDSCRESSEKITYLSITGQCRLSKCLIGCEQNGETEFSWDWLILAEKSGGLNFIRYYEGVLLSRRFCYGNYVVVNRIWWKWNINDCFSAFYGVLKVRRWCNVRYNYTNSLHYYCCDHFYSVCNFYYIKILVAYCFVFFGN